MRIHHMGSLPKKISESKIIEVRRLCLHMFKLLYLKIDRGQIYFNAMLYTGVEEV